jgi:hypothetical protein
MGYMSIESRKPKAPTLGIDDDSAFEEHSQFSGSTKPSITS